MAKNLLVINVDIRETRVALIENGIIAELHIERETSKGTLGNIYLGKVSRVLPGMQAAFIDVGLERAAFLHVEDLIRPDDFEAYLAGHRRGTDDERSTSSGHDHAGAGPSATAEEAPSLAEPVDEAEAIEAEAIETGEADAGEAEAVEVEALEADAEERDVDIELPTALDVSDSTEEEEPEPRETRGHDAAALAWERGPEADEGSEPDDEPFAAEAEEILVEERADESVEAEPAEPEGEAGAAPQAEASAPADQIVVRVPEEEAPVPRARSRRGRGRGEARVRRSGRTVDRQIATAEPAKAPSAEAPAPAARPASGGSSRAQQPAREGAGKGSRGRSKGDERRRGDERGSGRRSDERGSGRRDGREGRGAPPGREPKRGQHEPPRISKSTPIREVVREGQEVLVQISKEPIGTKGARVTSHISLPGRYVVYLPTVDHIGISKRIGSEKERSRLRESIEAMKPPQGGLIVRTLAEGLTKKQLKADVGYLVRLWGEVVKKRETGVRAPASLYTELDLVLKTARDLFTDDIEKIVIDSREEHERLSRFVEIFMPERVSAIELYQGEEPIFDAYGIEDEIQRAQSRKVPLPSGGYLIIDQAEALTAIDVNTGRFVGKGSKDLEETILATNLEAVEEIAYQLRFRNIGGLIILDLIDMERAQNREKVRKRLDELLAKDKAKTTVNRISDLGLIEMTRKRTRESLTRTVLEPCFYCDGTGQLQSKQTIAYEILRQIRRERMNLAGYVIVVNAHPAVVDLLKSDERVAVTEAERLFRRRLELIPRKEYHLEQFDLQGR
jgi:ribonuclease G